MAEHSKEHNLCNCPVSSVSQTLDEMEWERGIWYPALMGDVKRVEELLSRKGAARATDTAGYTALHYAARAGHVAVCRVLLASGADINALTRSGKATPLHRAAAAGRKETVEFLLQNGACAEAQDVDGQTALHRAAAFKHADVITILVSASAQLERIQDNNGRTALEMLSSTHSDIM